MDYKKKYKEALEKARKLCAYPTTEPFISDLQDLFPELKESEDEKIIKALIDEVSRWSEDTGFGRANIPRNTILAWLEKQGEQVKPKFKIGDWIISNITGFVYIVKDKGYGGYIVANRENHQYTISTDKEKDYRLWTIQDAKDGDVLVYRDGQWCFIYKGIVTEDTFKYYALLSEKGITVNDAAFSLLTSCIIPATNEQRDLLFQKMKEAGYGWYADKKELKKIEQKPAEWSEEDKNTLDFLVDYLLDTIKKMPAEEYAGGLGKAVVLLKSLKDRVQPKQEWDGGDEAHLHSLITHLEQWIERHPNTTGADIQGENIAWLKSLRPQMQWKAVDKEIYVKEPALVQRKDKSEPNHGYVICYDHTLTPDVYERFIMISDILSVSLEAE